MSEGRTRKEKQSSKGSQAGAVPPWCQPSRGPWRTPGLTYVTRARPYCRQEAGQIFLPDLTFQFLFSSAPNVSPSLLLFCPQRGSLSCGQIAVKGPRHSLTPRGPGETRLLVVPGVGQPLGSIAFPERSKGIQGRRTSLTCGGASGHLGTREPFEPVVSWCDSITVFVSNGAP